VSQDYKVLGYNQTGSGTTYGVLGRVDSPTGYGLYTPDDAKVDGITETGKIRASDDDNTDEVSVIEGHSTVSNERAETYGVHGISDADGSLDNEDPAGVKGTSTGGGETVGVLGVTRSTAGRATGLKGVAEAGSANAITADGGDYGNGLETSTSADNGNGVWARHIGSGGTSNSHAILAQTYTEADGVAGVRGEANGSGGNETYGIYGTSGSSAGYGTYSDGDSKTDGTHEVTGQVDAGEGYAGNVGASARFSSKYTLTGDTANYKLPFDTVVEDDRGEFNTTENRFETKYAGDYRVETGIHFSAQYTADTEVALWVVVNNRLEAFTKETVPPNSGSIDVYPQLSRTLKGLPPDSRIHIEASSDGSDNDIKEFTSGTYFVVTQVG
jgi:hypothetical protein